MYCCSLRQVKRSAGMPGSSNVECSQHDHSFSHSCMLYVRFISTRQGAVLFAPNMTRCWGDTVLPTCCIECPNYTKANCLHTPKGKRVHGTCLYALSCFCPLQITTSFVSHLTGYNRPDHALHCIRVSLTCRLTRSVCQHAYLNRPQSQTVSMHEDIMC